MKTVKTAEDVGQVLTALPKEKLRALDQIREELCGHSGEARSVEAE